MFTQSIRWRLLSWLGFLLVCILSCFGFTAYQLNRTNRLDQINENLTSRVAALSSDVRRPSGGSSSPGRPNSGRGPGGPPSGPPKDFDRRIPMDAEPPPSDFGDDPGGPPDGPGPRPGPPGKRGKSPGDRPVRLSARSLGLFDDTQTNGYYFVIWSASGQLMKRSSNAPIAMSIPARPRVDTSIHTRSVGAFQEAYHFTEIGECILAGQSIAEELEQMRRFGWWLFAVGGGVLLLGLAGGWLLTNQALRPLRDISVTAVRVAEGNLAERIDVAETAGELGRVAGVLNSTFARLEAAFSRQKQFTADASHELRTPLAAIIAEAQTTLAHPRNEREYRQAVEACLDTAQQMRRLTESLLALARLDSNQEATQRLRLDLADHARAGVELLGPLATERGLTIHCDFAPAEILGHPGQLDQVINNLVTNSIYYNKPGGEIRVSTGGEQGRALVIVADTGIGIGPEDLPNIFERFYRADKSRARADGRSGLGLAISKAIVEAHGGTIEVTTSPGVGSTFTVQLPASEPAESANA